MKVVSDTRTVELPIRTAGPSDVGSRAALDGQSGPATRAVGGGFPTDAWTVASRQWTVGPRQSLELPNVNSETMFCVLTLNTNKH